MTEERTLGYGYQSGGAGFITDVVYPNGKVLRVPPIPKSNRGGWYYHPLLKQKNGKRIVLGRSDVGRKAAADTMTEMLEIAYEQGNWEIPTVFSPLVGEHEVNQASIVGNRGAAAVTLPATFGAIRFAIGPRNHYQASGEWLVEVTIPTAVLTAMTKTIPKALTPACQTVVIQINSEEAEEYVDKLLSVGPIDAFTDFFKGRVTLKEGFGFKDVSVSGDGIGEWLQTLKFHMPYDKQHFSDAKNEYNGITISSDEEDPVTGRPMYTSNYVISDTVLSLSATWRQAYITEDATEAFGHLSTIFAASGVVFNLETLRKYDSITRVTKHFVKQLSVQIPEGGEHNRGGHTFVITPEDFKVTSCGYVSDEENFIDDAKRQALADIQTLVD